MDWARCYDTNSIQIIYVTDVTELLPVAGVGIVVSTD